MDRPGANIQGKLDKLRGRRRCGWFCQWRIRWLERQLPPVAPVGPPPPAKQVADAVANAGGVDPGISGYFGSWIYF